MRAKERLTGAIILVVLIVLVVPELLTGPRQADTQPSGATDEGAPLRSYTIELGERSSAKPARPLVNRVAEPERPPAGTEPTPASSAPKAEPPPANVSAPQPAPAKRSTESVPDSGWSVQVGSFASRENANRLTGELQRLGYRSFVKEGTSGARKLYRVRIGPEADRGAVEALARRIRADERLERDIRNGSIVPHP